MSAKVKLNMAGVGAILRGPEVEQELQRLGSEIAGAANAIGAQEFAKYHHGEPPRHAPYRAKINRHNRVTVCVVRPSGKHGAAIESKHHILKRMV